MTDHVRTCDDDELIARSGGHPLVRHLLPHRPPDQPGWSYGAAVGLPYDYWGGGAELTVVGPAADAAVVAAHLARTSRGLAMPADAFPLLPPGLLRDPHGWGFRWRDRPGQQPLDGVEWLADADHALVQALLDDAFPDASFKTGSPRVRRWAGLRDQHGRLVACAADTTEAVGVGFVASITTRPELRGQGLGRRITGWTLDQLVESEGTAALWHYGTNVAAAHVYDALAMHRLAMVNVASAVS